MLYLIGDAEFNEERGEVRRDSQQAVRLTQQISRFLKLLADHSDQLIPYARIYEHVWGKTKVSENSMSQCVLRARRALGHSSASPAIEVVYGQGVRLLRPVRRLSGRDGLDVRREGPAILILPFRGHSAELSEIGDRVSEELTSLMAVGRTVIDYTAACTLARVQWDSRELKARFGVEYIVTGRIDSGSCGLRAWACLSNATSRRMLGQVDASVSSLTHDDLAYILGARLSAALQHWMSVEAHPQGAEFERMMASHARIATLQRPAIEAAREELDRLALGEVVPRELHIHRALSFMYDYWLPGKCVRDGARAAIEAAIEADGAYAENVALLANVHSLSANHVAAMAAIESSVPREADDHLVHFMHSFALLGVGRVDDAIHAAERSLELVPFHPWAFNVWQLLGRAHLMQGDWDRAIDFGCRSRTLKPMFPEAVLDLALAYALSGQVDRGKETLARIRPDVSVDALCASRPRQNQAWEGTVRDGLERLGAVSP
jgi:DNA-binding winged helix-turn-helix (wHTH) protein/tetratricopeptide (TPR) repeat protein